MSIDAAERAELEHLRVATRALGLATWSLEVETSAIACATATFTGLKESFGYEHSDLPARLDEILELLVLPADQSRVLGELQACVDNGSAVYESQYRIRQKSGAIRWTLARGFVIRDTSGRPLRIVGSNVDVTPLKSAEEAATAAVERLQQSTKLSGVANWDYDLAGPDLASSKTAIDGWERLGYRIDVPSDLASGIALAVHPDDQAGMVSALRACIAGTTGQFEAEYRVRGIDGSLTWRLGRGVVVRDEHGAPLRLTGTSVDVTRLKRAEEKAEHAAEQLRLATDLTGVATWSFELTGNDLTTSKGSAVASVWDSLGYDPDAVPQDAASRIALAVAPEDQARVHAALQACIDGTLEHFEAEYRVRHRDGGTRWRLGRAFVIRDDRGQPIRLTGTSVDITRIKEAEAESYAIKVRLDEAMKLGGFTVIELDLRGVDDVTAAIVQGSGVWSERGLVNAVTVEDFLNRGVVPDDVQRAIEDLRLTIRTGPTVTELRTRDLHGDVRWRSVHSKCFVDERGVPDRLISVSYDIQQLKAAEDEARTAVHAQRLATDLSGVGVWGYNLVDGDLSTATSAFEIDGVVSSLGYEPDEIEPNLPSRMGAVVFPEDRPIMQQTLQDYFLGKTSQFNAECRFVHKDGSVVWRLVRGIATRDAAGVPLTFMGSAVDVTQLKETQAELQRVRDRLELAVTGSKACTWDFELTDGQIAGSEPVFTNAWELCGYEVPDDPQLVGQAFAVVIPSDEVGPFLGKIQTFLDGTEREWESPLRIAHKDGVERCHLTRGVVERDSAGRALRFTGTSIDITDRVRAESELQQSEERFRGTFENGAVGMILTDLEGRFLEYNTRFCDFLGYAREELIGRRFVDVMVPDEAEADLERQRAVVSGELGWFTRDKRYIRKDGVIVWGNITVTVIQRHADGTPVHVMGILQDITERKELEVEIEKAQSRLELAIRGSDVAVYEGDFSRGAIETATWKYFNMWEPMGIDPLDAPSDSESILARSIHPDEQHILLAQFQEAVATKSRNWYLEHRYIHNDGSVRWRLSRGTLVFDDAGQFTTLIGTETDITELKRIEGELQRARELAESASRAKDEFLGNVSHEIRTPMNAILGMTELALDSAPSEHQRQLLSTVRSAAKNLLTIINDLLDFSKIESGKLSLDCADFSLRAVVGDTLRALAVRAHRKGLELLCRVRPEVPDALDGDAGRLRQVLMNLVGNAIKFTPQGEVEVEVAADSSSNEFVALVFMVRDTGIGIARDKHVGIFNAFEQEDSSTTRKYGGTGLGLTISSQLARLMGGAITVQSAPGCGSTFKFTAHFARSKRPETTTVSPDRLANLKVLVVDDNETNRQILVEWTSSWRMEPTSARDGTEALVALASAREAGAPFSLVLLDARMPDTDGATLAGEIRRRWETRAPRLILLSSDDTASLSAQARENGVLAYLIKPVQQSELLETIWAVMNLDTAIPEASVPLTQSAHSQPLRVLVAEDNELNVTLLRELLKQRGHSVRFARDGNAALELALQGEFDLMLHGLHMPGLDGFDVVRAIRERERDTSQHLRIIALTARSSPRERARCIAAGMDEFLAKPIEAEALWATMARLMTVRGAPAIQPGLLDPGAIRRACAGDAGVLEKLVVVFRRTVPALMSRIRAALDRRDLLDLREAAHQLVGTVGAFSTVAADVALTLEDAAIREEIERCEALVERVAVLCAALLDATSTLSIDSLSL